MLNATLSQKIEITPELFIVRIKPDGGVPAFLPGQYVAVGLPGAAPRLASAGTEKEPAKADKIIKRAYSIGSAPSQRDFLEFYIALVQDGALTPRLAALNVGDRCFVAPKIVGEFTLKEVPQSANLVLVATGTGLAPYVAMVRDPSTWEGRSGKVTIVHGVRFNRDFAYREELQALERERSGFSYIEVVSREEPIAGGVRGHVQSVVLGDRVGLNAASDHVFLCGNPAMIEDLEKVLTEQRGFAVHSSKRHGNLHLEKYW